jgi:hypothetical protein
MGISAEPEILRPRSEKASAAFTDENLDMLSHLLDDFIRIPGTPIRFGLDGIVGLIPGIGDVLGGIASCILIVAAWVRGVPNVTIVRMIVNVAIETAVGAIPVVGDVFDIAWRANRRNYRLLEGSLATPGHHTLGSWIFLACVLLTLVVLVALPVLLAGWLLNLVWHGIQPPGLGH